MKSWLLCCLLSSCLIQGIQAKKKYHGYELVVVTPTTITQLELLHRMSQNTHLEVDFWHLPRELNREVTMSVSGEDSDELKNILISAGMSPVVVVSNLQNLIDDQEKQLELDEIFAAAAFRLNAYNSVNKIQDYLDDVPSFCAHCRVIKIGRSSKRKHLKVIKVSYPNGNTTKKAIFIDGGLHAREWISPATALNIIQRLADLDYNSPLPDIQRMTNYDWYILPLANPDGYKYSRRQDRLWRKTRRKKSNLACIGVDANRNFDIDWAGARSSNNSCSITYAGPSAFSEPETRAIRNTLLAQHFHVYLSLHSYSQLWLTTWGYKKDDPSDYHKQKGVATAAVEAIKQTSGRIYRAGSVSSLLYTVSGNSMDWARAVAGVDYSFAVELRDTGNYGFLLPASEIPGQVEEIWAALAAMIKKIY